MTPESPAPAGPVTATVQSLYASLNPGEQRVCDVVLRRSEWVIEATTADVAEEAGVSTATVVRAAQRLGYRGFPHLKVLLARDLGVSSPVTGAGAAGPGDVREFFRQVGASIESMAALLDEQLLERAVDLLAGARRILVAGGGVSAPVAQDIGMRLAASGRAADAPADTFDQRIRARLLGPEDVCVIVSGTGATASTLYVARAAATAGAPVIALTSFARSALSEIATVELLTTTGAGLREELQSTFRIPQLILGNALVAAVAARDPEASAATRAKVLEVVATELDD